jgi:predicted amidohydrolase YtcJ
MPDPAADLIILARTVHPMAGDAPPVTALAVRDGKIAATAGPDGRAELTAAWRGPGTVLIDDPGLTVLPAFVDTHNHLMLAGQNILGVPVSQAGNIARLVAMIAERAAQTPPGQWIRSAADWHELGLAERRLPTAAELDQATTEHPVLVQRGGHNGVLNSAALRLSGIGRDTPDIEGGLIDRDASGEPRGWLQDAALDVAFRAVPPLPEPALRDGLAQASAQYAAHGLGTVRDPAVSPGQWHAYRGAQAAGQLAVRSHAMIFTTAPAVAAAGSMDAYLDGLQEQGIRPGAGDGLLRLWGLKFGLDGGVEAAALEEPYADRPGYRGELLWDREALTAAFTVCLRRGWPVGVHAMGDRANAVLLAAMKDAAAAAGPVPPGMLVIEHGGLIGDRIAEAAGLGVHITVQQALLDGLGPAFLQAWGPERTAALFPWRELVDAGAWISAGTDHPIGPLSPLRAVHGMTTRRTPAGVLGPEHAIGRAEALRLYTVAGAGFLSGPASSGPAPGTLVPGAPADLACYPADPFTCPDEELLSLSPAATVIGGRVAYRATG